MTAPYELVSGITKKQVELVITGRTINGDEAEAMGIVTRAVEPDILESEVCNLAKAIALMPLDAICMGKMCRRHAYDQLGLNNWIQPVVYHTLATTGMKKRTTCSSWTGKSPARRRPFISCTTQWRKPLTRPSILRAIQGNKDALLNPIFLYTRAPFSQ